jgi:RNA polymerase sigma-70 factor (ECF subfamily)
MTDQNTTHTPLTGRTNHEWITDLQGPEQDAALSDLRALLLRGLRAALYTHIHDGLDSILEDFVQEALIKILNNIDTFRGESRFTTWAQKIAVNVAFTELRRRRWQNVSLQDMIDRYDSNDFTPAILTDPGFSPEKRATLRIIMETINTLIEEELTDKQREAIQAVILGGVPLEEVARRMDTNRNALYKLLHDARKRLKQHLLNTGISAEEVLAIFDNR